MLSRSFSLSLAAVVMAGCGGRDPEPWRGPDESGDVATMGSDRRDGEFVDDNDLGPPPAFNPDGPSTGGSVDWQPSGTEVTAPEATKIDTDALRSGDPRPGGDLNRFFPPQSGDDDMVAKQEKEGFAQYSLRRGGEEVGQLSITDLRSNPAAADKFRTPASMIGGFPAVADGSKGTTLLVNGRYQVKVRSPGGQLNESQRREILQSFDLSGLADLD